MLFWDEHLKIYKNQAYSTSIRISPSFINSSILVQNGTDVNKGTPLDNGLVRAQHTLIYWYCYSSLFLYYLSF